MQLILYFGKRLDLEVQVDKMYSIDIKPEHNSPIMGGFVTVTPSIYSLFRLDRNSYSQLPQPYSNCLVLEDNTLTVPLANRTMFDLTVEQGYAYTQQYCINICVQVWINKICDCNLEIYPYKVSNKPYCVTKECSVLYNQEILADCKSLCPLECSKSIITSDKTEVELDKNFLLSFESVRNFDFARDMPNGTDLYQFMNDNVVVIDIEYYSSGYTEISQSPKMDWQDLLSELGGHLHLFLGMSLLSFVEVVELFAFMVVSNCSNNNSR